MVREISSVAVAVVEWNDHFLIGCRSLDRTLAGYWEFPGGRLEAGETPAAAAVRECREETGLTVRVTGAYPDAVHEYAHARVHLHFLACEPALPAPAPRPPFRWVSRQELSQYIFPPANAALLVRLLAGESCRPAPEPHE